MSIDYSREKCEDLVRRIMDLGPDMPQRIWLQLQDPYVNLIFRRDEEDLIIEFNRMSLWNKQAVLFMLVPHIEQIAAREAKKLCDLARQREPL